MTAQLSPLRVGKITGSRIASVIGQNKYEPRKAVLRSMVREALGFDSEFTGNAATEFGQEHEADAIFAYEADRWVDVHSRQLFVAHPEHDFLAVTVDGLVGDDGVLEVKCPPQASYTTVPRHYLPQVMLQLACTGRAWCDFAIFRLPERAAHLCCDPLTVQRVHADESWLPHYLPVLRKFHDEFQRVVADPELAAAHLEDVAA